MKSLGPVWATGRVEGQPGATWTLCLCLSFRDRHTHINRETHKEKHGMVVYAYPLNP